MSKLTDEQVTFACGKFATHELDLERLESAKLQVGITYDEVMRTIRELDPEPEDRYRIIERYKEMAEENPATVKNPLRVIQTINEVFDILGIIERVEQQEKPANRRTDILKKAVNEMQAGRKRGKQHTTKKSVQTLKEIELQLDKGHVDRALAILDQKIWEAFQALGKLARNNYDLRTIEEIAERFSNEYVKAWHDAYDGVIADEMAAAARAQKAAKRAKK